MKTLVHNIGTGIIATLIGVAVIALYIAFYVVLIGAVVWGVVKVLQATGVLN